MKTKPFGSRGGGKKPSATEVALRNLASLPFVQPTDDVATKRKTLDALRALSDAAVAEGMEVWSEERISVEVARRRGLSE